MMPKDIESKLSEEAKAKLKGCETPEELVALAQEEGYELSDEQIDQVSGGEWYSHCDTYETCTAHNIGE